jgi:hypothetical protein
MNGTSGLRITNYSVLNKNQEVLWVSIPWEQVIDVAREMIQWFDTKEYMNNGRGVD